MLVCPQIVKVSVVDGMKISLMFLLGVEDNLEKPQLKVRKE